jgi:hypothetical protein
MDEQALAHHEAGHGVCALLAGWPVTRVSLVPDAASLGHCRPATKPDDREHVDWLPYLLAGGAAERQLTGRPAEGDGHDLEVARLLVSVVKHVPIDAPIVARALNEWGFIADHRVRVHWRWIARTAQLLVRRRVLTGAQIAALYDPRE